MTKEEVQGLIQTNLRRMMTILEEDVLPLAREHKVEFSFMGMTYHLFPTYDRDNMEVWNAQTEKWDSVPRPPAKDGLLVSDEEWDSSGFTCSSRYWKWVEEQWPTEDE